MNNIEIIQTIEYARNLMRKMESSVHCIEDLKKPIVNEFLNIFKGEIGDREQIIYRYGVEYERSLNGKFLRIVGHAERMWLLEAYLKCVENFSFTNLCLDVEGRKLNLNAFTEEIVKFVEKLEKSELPLEVVYKKNLVNIQLAKMMEDFQ